MNILTTFVINFYPKAKKPVEEVVTAVILPEPVEPHWAKGMERTRHYLLFCPVLCAYTPLKRIKSFLSPFVNVNVCLYVIATTFCDHIDFFLLSF